MKDRHRLREKRCDLEAKSEEERLVLGLREEGWGQGSAFVGGRLGPGPFGLREKGWCWAHASEDLRPLSLREERLRAHISGSEKGKMTRTQNPKPTDPELERKQGRR